MSPHDERAADDEHQDVVVCLPEVPPTLIAPAARALLRLLLAAQRDRDSGDAPWREAA